MAPIRIGAALDVADLPRYRDWLIADQRDLEIQDFHATEVLLGDWEDRAATARAALDGFEGRLGIHGPFVNVPISCNDPELRPIVTNRYLTGLRAAIAVGASQMVIHSPFTIWDDKNYGDKPGRGNDPSHKDSIIAACHEVLAPVRAAGRGSWRDPRDRELRRHLAPRPAGPRAQFFLGGGQDLYRYRPRPQRPLRTGRRSGRLFHRGGGRVAGACAFAGYRRLRRPALGRRGAARSTGRACFRLWPPRPPIRIWCWSCATAITSPTRWPISSATALPADKARTLHLSPNTRRGIGHGARRRDVRRRSGDATARRPDAMEDRHAPDRAEAEQIGAHPLGQLPAIHQPGGARRRSADRRHPRAASPSTAPPAASRSKAAPRARSRRRRYRASRPLPARRPRRCRNATRPGSGSARPSSPRSRAVGRHARPLRSSETPPARSRARRNAAT